MGPGCYEPSKEFNELKIRTKSKKPPAFMDGIEPGKITYAVGSNYLLPSYNPSPALYDT